MLVFLFTDIEGSTRLWELHTGLMTSVIARHDEILRELIESHGAEVDGCLQRAYERVMLVASKIQDEGLRQSWLENVPDNREIVAEWQARQKDS